MVKSPLLERVEAVLAQLGQPVKPPSIDVEQVFEAMQSDKKVRGGRVRIAVPERLGVGVVRETSASDVRAAFRF